MSFKNGQEPVTGAVRPDQPVREQRTGSAFRAPEPRRAVMTPSLKPLADRVVVERLPAPEKTTGGIVLPDTAKDKPQEGTVIAAGPGRFLENGQQRALEVHEGDR